MKQKQVFFGNFFAFSMIQWMLAIWRLIPLLFLNPAWTSGSSQFTYCWSLTWRILRITLLGNKHNCMVVWTFFGITHLWDWNENWPFPVLWPLLSVPNLLAYWEQHFHSIIFQDLKQLSWNSITSTSFVCGNVSEGPLGFTLQDVWLSAGDHPIMVILRLRPFLYVSYHLFSISSASIGSLLFLSFIVTILAWNVSLISSIFSKSSLVFPILFYSFISFHCWFKKAFLPLLAIPWNSVFRWVYLAFPPLPFISLLFSAVNKASSHSHFACFHSLLGMVLAAVPCTVPHTSVLSPSGCQI